jgi:dTDP-glucose 4,6-dehydratase
LPRATFIIAGGMAGLAILAIRFLQRRARTLRSLSRGGNRTLIYGAGDAGSQLATLMQTDRTGRFLPVGFLDDDPGKRHLRRANLRVLGTGGALESVAIDQGIETLVIAIAGVSSERLQSIDRTCAALGVRVQVIPTAAEIVGGAIRLGDVSDLSEEEIMGRRPVETDEAEINEFIRGKTILITGAGGSIGSELSRQVHRYQPKRVVLLDRDESALHETQLSIDGTGLLSSEDLILCDIRDADRVSSIVSDISPDIIFHAAALKHLSFLERFPHEAWKTNVQGTMNVAVAAEASGVRNFVNISTDKAAEPTSVLGFSKRITERLVASLGPADCQWVSVRFGNVLGSRGSVITTFRHQIAKGGPVTVTHPDVTRYFMTIREAVHLVLQAAVLGERGETLILDMGKPLKIADIAQYMIQRSGREIPITYAGLRSGEKLEEILISVDEVTTSTKHPLISHTRVTALEALPDDEPRGDDDARATMQLLAIRA